jgi:hypothetical protein
VPSKYCSVTVFAVEACLLRSVSFLTWRWIVAPGASTTSVVVAVTIAVALRLGVIVDAFLST